MGNEQGRPRPVEDRDPARVMAQLHLNNTIQLNKYWTDTVQNSLRSINRNLKARQSSLKDAYDVLTALLTAHQETLERLQLTEGDINIELAALRHDIELLLVRAPYQIHAEELTSIERRLEEAQNKITDIGQRTIALDWESQRDMAQRL